MGFTNKMAPGVSEGFLSAFFWSMTCIFCSMINSFFWTNTWIIWSMTCVFFVSLVKILQRSIISMSNIFQRVYTKFKEFYWHKKSALSLLVAWIVNGLFTLQVGHWSHIPECYCVKIVKSLYVKFTKILLAYIIRSLIPLSFAWKIVLCSGSRRQNLLSGSSI